jgi:NAD(P)H-dependent FMN reductase
MTTIGVILGSTRPARRVRLVGDWIAAAARTRADGATYELLDLADFDLPVLDEAAPAKYGAYARAHTLRWSAAVDACDGFVVVSPEYNHSFPGSLKNAIDYLAAEWENKAAGFVTYGVQGGIRAAEQLRVVFAELHVATVRDAVGLQMFSDFEVTDPLLPGTLTPGDHQESTLHVMLDQVVAWSEALAPLRAPAASGAA